MYSISKREHPIQFVNAFDILREQKRKLFGMPEIDNLLNFSDKKNICIVNRSTKYHNFLYSLFTQFCIDFYCFSNIDDLKRKNKTILIDAGSGNNLGYIHQNLIEKSIKTGFKTDKVLDNIIIVRAFTFYQFANIIINELPQFMNSLDCNIQIIVIDLLDTLFKTNRKRNSEFNLKKDFDENAKILDEIVNNLISISDKHFVIVSYNDIKNIAIGSITSKFKNTVNLNENYDISKEREQDKNKMQLQLEIKSINNIAKDFHVIKEG
jgi:hypothetical protein